MPRRCLRSGLILLALAGSLVGCSVAASPSGAAPASSASAALPSAAATTSPQPSPPDSSEPASSLPADLGPAPTIQYPEVQALGVGTITLTRPVSATAHFWLACEWPTTASVAWLYPEGATLLGEAVHPWISFDPSSPTGNGGFWLARTGIVAPYAGGPSTTMTTDHSADWTSATITFTALPLNPEFWEPGPLPTPKAAFERPLGGQPGATELDGTVGWACGQRPATVPTPGPPMSEEPLPSLPFDRLPDATLHVGDETAVGQPGCGVSWEGYGSGGADSCGPSYQVIKADGAVHAAVGEKLRLTLPTRFRFTAWSMSWVEQSAAELYRGEQPPDMHHRAGEQSLSTTSLTLAGLPAGDWSVIVDWSATDGKLTITGMPDYFRVIVR